MDNIFESAKFGDKYADAIRKIHELKTIELAIKEGNKLLNNGICHPDDIYEIYTVGYRKAKEE